MALNQALRPGVYLGQLITPNPSGTPDLARLPILVGRGHRLGRVANSTVVRSFVYNEPVGFAPVAPHVATLLHQSNQDKASPNVVLVDQNGTEVNKAYWKFNSRTEVEITPALFDATAEYFIDYQSVDRDVLDPVPVADIRGNVRASVQVDQDEFIDGQHFHLPVDFSTLVAGLLDATYLGGSRSPVITVEAAAGNTSTHSLEINAGAGWTHDYSRRIVVECTAFNPNPGSDVAAFNWYSEPLTGGVEGTEPHNPLDPNQTAERGTINLAEAGVFTALLEHGLIVEADFAGAAFVVGDSWTFECHAAPRVEVDPRHLASNDYAETDVTVTAANGAFTVTPDPLSVFTGDHANRIEMEVLSVGGDHATNDRTATVMFSHRGDLSSLVSGVFTVDETVPASSELAFSNNIDLVWSWVDGQNPVVGDTIVVDAVPPRLFTAIRESRVYSIDVTSVLSNGGVTQIVGSMLTNTPEGGWGSFTINPGSYVNITNSTAGLPDGLRLIPMNVAESFAIGTQQWQAGDKFGLAVEPQNVIDWTLRERRVETLAQSGWLFDPMGRITGVASTWYYRLARSPESVVSVSVGGVEQSGFTVLANGYLYTTAQPAGDVRVVYEWRSAEPAPGQTYYVTANYLRGDELYNEPILVRNKSEARTLLAPMSAANDLLIGVLGMFEAGAVGVYVVQVKDADDDGLYVDTDYETAIEATKLNKRGTDLIVLNRPGVLAAALAATDAANLISAQSQRLLWYGAAQGTPVGDTETLDTLVYLATRTLQVYGDSQSHGTRIMVGPTWAKVTIQHDNGSTQQVTVDGSFVAAFLAGMVSGFERSYDTVLHKTFGYFDAIQTYSEADYDTLGANQIIWMTDQGSGVFRVEENFTCDNFNETYRYINAMTQRQLFKRFLRVRLEAAIALVPPSRSQAVQVVKGLASAAVRDALANDYIAAYQDSEANERAFDPDLDLLVQVSTGNSTRVELAVNHFIRYTIKEVVGLISVDSASGASFG